MTVFSSLHPLKYIAEALSQMAATLRDFGMSESAELLDKAIMLRWYTRERLGSALARRTFLLPDIAAG